MNCGKKYDLSEKKCPKRKCPVCGGKIETQYTEEEMREIKKQNDDMVVINTLLM
jgi:rRNA maturation endonuclease Nob1